MITETNYLLHVFVLHCHIMKSNDHNLVPILERVRVFSFLLLASLLAFPFLLFLITPRNQLILDQNKSLHRMVQCQLMLVHLRQDGTYIQMDLTRVRYLKTLLHISLTLVQTCILYVQRLLQVVQSIPQLVRLLEETRVIVVSNGS